MYASVEFRKGSAILGVGYTCYGANAMVLAWKLWVKLRRDAELGKWYNTMVHEEHKQQRRYVRMHHDSTQNTKYESDSTNNARGC